MVVFSALIFNPAFSVYPPEFCIVKCCIVTWSVLMCSIWSVFFPSMMVVFLCWPMIWSVFSMVIVSL